MRDIIIKIHSDSTTIAQHEIKENSAQPLVIQAVPKVNYELVDVFKEVAPDHIVTRRQGNDLAVVLKNDTDEPGLIIKDYFTVANSPLIGVAENGNFYYYTPDTGDVQDYMALLQADSNSSGHALGGEELGTPWWAGTSATISNEPSEIISSSFGYPLFAGLFTGTVLISELVNSSNDKDNDNNNSDNSSNNTDNPSVTSGTVNETGITYTGDDNKNSFTFSELLDGNVTNIKNFDTSEDVLKLSKSVFTALATTTDETGNPINLMDYINYDSTTGNLSYDSDAGGAAEAVHFATLDVGLMLTEQNFQVIG